MAFQTGLCSLTLTKIKHNPVISVTKLQAYRLGEEDEMIRSAVGALTEE